MTGGDSNSGGGDGTGGSGDGTGGDDGGGDPASPHKCDRKYCNCRCHDITGAALSDRLPGPPALVLEEPECGEGTGRGGRDHDWVMGGILTSPQYAAADIQEYFGISAIDTCRNCLACRLQMDTLPEGMPRREAGGACYMRADDWMAWYLPLLHMELVHADRRRRPAFSCDKPMPNSWFADPPKPPAAREAPPPA